RGGLSVDVQVASNTPDVGTVVGNPAVFSGGDDLDTATAFHPVGTGTTLVIATAPTFTTPSDGQLTVTVTQPTLHFSAFPFATDGALVGRNLQVQAFVTLDEASPSPVTVTVTSSDASVVSLSTDPSTAGGASVSFPGVTGT